MVNLEIQILAYAKLVSLIVLLAQILEMMDAKHAQIRLSFCYSEIDHQMLEVVQILPHKL
jgi:hypothetical protein